MSEAVPPRAGIRITCHTTFESTVPDRREHHGDRLDWESNAKLSMIEPLQPLPSEARRVLEALHAPPRLLVHLALVHEVAYELLEGMAAAWPDLPIDREAVLMGAATHDAGKIVHRVELRQPGTKHEDDGPAILVEHGLPANIARFARTHGQWSSEPSATLEDLIVALADLLWVGKRDQSLEDEIIKRLAEFSSVPLWSAFAAFDELELQVLEGAGHRFALYKKIADDEDSSKQLPIL